MVADAPGVETKSPSDLTMVIAYVRPARAPEVASVLRRFGVSGWCEAPVVGHGAAAGGHGIDHLRFEALVAAEHAPELARLVGDAAHTGVDGDGLVLCTPVISAERISNLAVGKAALRRRLKRSADRRA